MSTRGRIVVGAALVVAVGLLGWGWSHFGGRAASSGRMPGGGAPGVAGSPYAGYEFGERVLDIGTIPFDLVGTAISECLLHDRILHRELAAEGWSMREHRFAIGVEMTPFCDGRLDVMILGDTAAATAMGAHEAGVFALCRQGYNTLVAKPGVTLHELKGLRIGYAVKAASHYTLQRALKSVNLSVSDIISVPLNPSQMNEALRDGSVDAVVAREPFTAMILEKTPGARPIYRFDTHNFVAMDLGFVSANPRIQKAVLVAVLRATRWMARDDAGLFGALEWVRRAGIDFTGKSPVKPDAEWGKILRMESIDNPTFPMIPLEYGDEDGAFSAQIRFLQEQGVVPASAEWKTIRSRINLTLMPELIRAGETLKIDEFDYAPEKLVKPSPLSP